MKKIIFAIAIVFGYSVASFAESTYVVRPGDTILKISDRLIKSSGGKKDPRRYQMSRQLLKMNPQVADPNQLTVGDSIKIPDTLTAKENEAKPVPVPAPVTVAPAVTATPVPEEPSVVLATPVAPPIPASESPDNDIPPPLATVTENEVKSEDHGPAGQAHNVFMIQPRVQFNEYEIENTTTEEHLKVHSKIVAGLGFGYGRALTEKLHLFVKAGANYTQLDKFNSAANSLGNSLRWVKNFGAGVEYHLLHSLKVEFMALYVDHLFILTDGANSYKVANVAMPGAELVFDWGFYHFSAGTLGLTGAAEYVGSASKDGVKYESAIEPVGSLYWQSARGAEKMNYRLAAIYTTSHQSPEKEFEVKQHMTSWGAALSLMFPF